MVNKDGGQIHFVMIDLNDPDRCEKLLQFMSQVEEHLGENMQIIDFFNPNMALTTPLIDDRSKFKSNLNHSTWSRSFIHGADMMPGMIQGFSKFLENKGLKLGDIRKIRFKDKTDGDLIYGILSEANDGYLQHAKVLGEFTDNDGNTYYFYAYEEKWISRDPLICGNILPQVIFGGKIGKESLSSNTIRFSENINPKLVEYPLGVIRENTGYMRATVMDILNHFFIAKAEESGLVIGYNNLHTSPDFDPERLLNGTCSMTIMEDGEVCKVKKGSGNGHKFRFSINHKDHGEVVSGGVSFFVPTE